MASAPDDLFGYGDPAGLGDLRTELARYLNRTRNTVATTESIIIVAGVASGIAQIVRFLHRAGARAVAVEEPGFPFHQAVLQREGPRFIDQGDLGRHIRRVRSLYRTRRDQLLDTIRSVIDQPDIRGVSAGLHLTVALPQGLDETSAVQRALDEHRLALRGLRQHYLTSTAIDGLVLGFSRPATNFQDITARLANILGRSNR